MHFKFFKKCLASVTFFMSSFYIQGLYWLSKVVCNGMESKLNDCQLDRWGEYNCSTTEAAGVICESTERTSKNVKKPKMDKIMKFMKSKENMKVRLRGGRLSTEGRVEVISKLLALFV